MKELPAGRVFRESDDHYGILLDVALYGNVYNICRVPGEEPKIVITMNQVDDDT